METIEKNGSGIAEQAQVMDTNADFVKKPYTYAQFLHFCIGFFGLQFAWQMRIILSGPVTEPLGASPFIFGLIWLAGPFTGMIVQPIIGAMSDKSNSRFGKRRPFLFLGAILASLALWAFPNSAGIVDFFSSSLNQTFPVWSALLFAAIAIWVIDGSVNAAQGPYRALVPDNIPQEQHSIANSFLSFAIGLGSVVAAGTAPFLKWMFDYQMTIEAQFLMASIAFTLATIWTCTFTKELSAGKKAKEQKTEKKQESTEGFWTSMMKLFSSSPEVTKISIVQFFSWIGVMSMFIFFTQFTVHILCGVPNLANASEAEVAAHTAAMSQGTNFASICFALFNLVCFLVSLPIGILSSKYGNKNVHAAALFIMAGAFLAMAFTTSFKLVALFMAIAGIGWASILALPFAIFSKFIKKGTEGSAMGVFNIFIAGPQVLVCTLLAWFISSCAIEGQNNYHWEYAFIVGAVSLVVAACVALSVNEHLKVVEFGD